MAVSIALNVEGQSVIHAIPWKRFVHKEIADAFMPAMVKVYQKGLCGR